MAPERKTLYPSSQFRVLISCPRSDLLPGRWTAGALRPSGELHPHLQEGTRSSHEEVIATYLPEFGFEKPRDAGPPMGFL